MSYLSTLNEIYQAQFFSGKMSRTRVAVGQESLSDKSRVTQFVLVKTENTIVPIFRIIGSAQNGSS